MVHRETCPNVRGYQKEPDKYMAVAWSEEYDKEFIAELKVDMLNNQGALAELTNVISKTGSNIHGLSTEEPRRSLVHRYRSANHQRSCSPCWHHA